MLSFGAHRPGQAASGGPGRAVPTEQGASVPPFVVGERQAVTALHRPALITQALSHIHSNPGSARDVLCREGSGTKIRSQTMGPLLPEGLPSAPLGTQGGQSQAGHSSLGTPAGCQVLAGCKESSGSSYRSLHPAGKGSSLPHVAPTPCLAQSPPLAPPSAHVCDHHGHGGHRPTLPGARLRGQCPEPALVTRPTPMAFPRPDTATLNGNMTMA